MNILYKIFLPILILIAINSFGQADTKTGFKNWNPEDEHNPPGFENLNNYYDSLFKITDKPIIIGNVYTIFNETAPDCRLLITFDDKKEIELIADSLGRFYFVYPDYKIDSIKIQVSDNEYKKYDTIFKSRPELKDYFHIKVTPRYKILLKGKVYQGTVPKEDVDVTIIHNKDTFNLKTLDCYFDKEDYWNCLYDGMFKQAITFDNPNDSIIIKTSYPGFIDNIKIIDCSKYDGNVIDIKLQYSDKLPYFPTNNISLSLSPPFVNDWMVEMEYMYNPQKFKRFSAGVNIGMLISEYEYEFNTFPDLNNSTDSSYLKGTFDTAYISFKIAPKFKFWFTKPEQRNFGIYSGLEFPYMIPQNKFYLHAFIGGRFYIDLNKALLVELKYINYDLNLVKYDFNPYGNGYSYSENSSFNKLLINFGLLVSF